LTKLARAALFALIAVMAGQATAQVEPRPDRLQPGAEVYSFPSPSPSGSYLAGQQAFGDLRTADAASYLLDATEEEWENPAVVERAFTALAADGRIDDAHSLARHMLELAPGHDMSLLLNATVALKERRYGAVLKQLEQIGLDNFVGITAAVVRSWAHIGQGDTAAAFGSLGELDGSGLDSFLVFHRALMADIADDDRALEYARKAYESDPYVARIVEAYARMLGRRGRVAEAREVIRSYQDEGLDHPAIELVRTRLENGATPGRFAGTVSVGAAEVFHGIGSALARDGARDIAMVFLRLGYYLDPKSDIIALTIGELLDGAGQHEAANAVYEAIPPESLLKQDATVRMAENLEDLGDREEAIRRLGNIVTVQPDNLDAISALGDMLRFDEQYERAIEVYSKAIDLTGGVRPRDWRFYYVRGIAYERDGQWALAENDLQEALELNPGQPQVLNYLGYSWVDQDMHLQEALGMIEEAVSAAPRDGYIVDSLGWAYYKLGRHDEAVSTLERAVRLLPNDPEINDHLGDAYWEVGRKREARFQWTIARDVDERGNVSERAGVKLLEGLPTDDA